MGTLRIPAPDRTAIAIIAKLDDGPFDELVSLLQNAPCSIDPAKVVEKLLPSAGEVLSKDLPQIAELTWRLYSVKEGRGGSTADFIQDVSTAMERGESTSPSLDKSSISRLQARLARLLELDTVRVSARAADLRLETANIFEGARLLTDLRPVFGQQHDAPLLGALIQNTLKITYWSEGKSSDIFLSLDRNDLKTLKEIIDRAENKSEKLADFLKQSNVNNFDSDK